MWQPLSVIESSMLALLPCIAQSQPSAVNKDVWSYERAVLPHAVLQACLFVMQ
jgi:hypothetical protein